MGTNYYLYDEVTQEKLHICKISSGWKPLFQSHEGKFTNMNQLEQFYLSNDCRIINEYDEVISWLDFYVKAFNRASHVSNKSHTKAIPHITVKGIWEFTNWDFR